MCIYKRDRGRITLFCDTADEITIDPASREMISLPAEKIADLVAELEAQKNPKLNWDNEAVVRYFAKTFLPRAQKQRKNYAISYTDCAEAVLEVLNSGMPITTKAAQERIMKRAAAINKLRSENIRTQRALSASKKKAAQAQARAVAARQQLYRDYGMRVPSRKKILEELDRPFQPSKAAEQRQKLKNLKEKYGPPVTEMLKPQE